VATGPPILSIMAKIFIKFYGDNYITNHFYTKNITPYTRYVEDILTAYGSTKTVAEIISNVNQNRQNITLIPTYEYNGQTCLLELTLILKVSVNLLTPIQLSIFFQTIPQNKMTVYRYYITLLHSLPFSLERKQKNGQRCNT
jgi:hypothetical protein